jgi:hypothetical protein
VAIRASGAGRIEAVREEELTQGARTGMRHIYHVDDGENWWYSAESEEAALAMHKAPMSEGEWKDIEEETTVKQEPDDKILKVHNEDDDTRVEKTCAEWAGETEGFIATTCW